MRSENKNKNKLFYSASASWLISLLAWMKGFDLFSQMAAILALLSFLLYGLLRMKTNMFGKKTRPESSLDIPLKIADPNGEISKECSHQKNTIIGADVHIEGNITASDQIYIYGKLSGDVDASGGIVKIMCSGFVEGNIVCRHLIVDGSAVGECQAEDIEISERGIIEGKLTYTSLCVKKGGIFTGGANRFKVQDKASVTDLITTKEDLIG